MSRDNWERLVAAVLKREQLWQLFHQQSRSPSISTISSSNDFSGEILDFSNDSLGPICVSPLTNSSVSQVTQNAARPITQKLFAAWYRKRKAQDEYFDDVPGEQDLGLHLGRVTRFSLHELQVATDNFSDKNIIEYGHNMVYKGMLADGSPVAVKRHKDRGGFQTAEVQFQTEVEINSIALHPNVLHMLGFCITSNERLIVYPLLANGSVASWLRGRHESQTPLNWSVRKGIALGAARGIAYLHNKCDPQIIHRDIKASNILLDEDFEAVVGDFELAIIMDHDVTHAATSVVGTVGHRAPEYLSHGACSEKTDVYGYGAFLLELITGQRALELAKLANEDGMTLLDWIRRNSQKRKWEVMADKCFGGDYMEEVVEQFTKIALLCVQSTPERCPKMSEIVRMLEVGDLLAERWEEGCSEEMFCQYVANLANSSDIEFDDDISIVLPEVLSGPR